MKRVTAVFAACLFWATSLPVATGLASVALVPMTGCTQSQVQEVEALSTVAIQTISNILSVAAPGDPGIAILAATLNGLQTAEKAYVAGSGTLGALQAALQGALAAMAGIPEAALYAQLIALAVSGIEAVLTYIQSTQTTVKASLTIQANPWHGKVPLKGRSLLHPTHIGAFKAQWNAICKADPKLVGATLK